jgi:hypothetical protein
MFSNYEYRGHKFRQGISLDSSAFGYLMKKQRYVPAERGQVFADRFMNVCARVTSQVEQPWCDSADKGTCYPVSIILKPRNVEFVEENEKDREPRWLDLERNERWQYDKERKQSMVATTVHSSDISEDFFTMIAAAIITKAGTRGDASEEVREETRVKATPSNFAMGTPVRRTDAAPALRAQLFQDTGTPEVISVEEPPSQATLPQDEMQRTIARLKRKDWVKNPYFIPDDDWQHIIGLACTVLETMFETEEEHHIDGLKRDSFWPVLTPLIQGDILDERTRAKSICADITGHPKGMDSEDHPRLLTTHDLPGYMLYQKKKYQDLHGLKSDQAAHSKMDRVDFFEHVVRHVSHFMPGVKASYRERRSHKQDLTVQHGLP